MRRLVPLGVCDDAAMQTPEPHPQPHPAALSARQAADTLGVHEKTVRRWIERGTLTAAKDESGAFRIDPAEVERHRAGQAADTPRGHAAPAADRAADTAADVPLHAAPVAADRATPVDLRPLADVIERQGEEIRRLTEAATIWQFRAGQLEDQLKQLTAGGPVVEQDAAAPDRGQDAPGGAEAAPMAPDAPRSPIAALIARLLGRG